MIHKTTRSILSVLLAALLLVTSIPLTPAFADGGAVSPQSESGEGRALEQVDGVYQIYTADDLKEFADIVNGTHAEGINQNTSANAKLMNDIDLSSVCSEENGTWTPIGNSSSNSYRGTFNGAGHTISGLYIDSSDNDYQGLFGYLSTDGGNIGTVKDLSVSGSVSGDWYVGGVVGRNFSGTVTGCTFSGSVSGNIYVGGVVGYNGGTVENCYNTGSVSGNSVGGVVGYNSGTVENCYNTGSVSGETTVNVGGVVGYNHSDGSVTNSYNTGAVSGGEEVGGVVGQNFGNGIVTGCYFLQTNELNNGLNGIGGDSSNTNATPVDDLPELCKKFESVTGWTTSPFCEHPVLKTNPEGGLGTATHPYEIKTAAQLETFRDIVNGANRQVKDSDAHAKLMNDINLKDVCGPTLDSGQPVSWTPIGNIIDEEAPDSFGYTGTFNGDGHTISGLYIDDSTANDQGLFGFVGRSGKVQNLSVSGSVSGNNYVGGIVGYNNGGNVTGCTFSGSGSVSGYWYVGGVVGYNNGGTVTGCIFSGSGSVSGVTGSDYVGGVVGDNRGTVENCHNTGSVKGSGNSVGGVVGYNSSSVVGDNRGSVENCFNTGNVSGSDHVGGVVGLNFGSVENCYNTDSVSGDRFVGGVVGDNRGSVENCYNTGTGTVTGTVDYVGGVVGDNRGSVENCYNTGSVKGPDSVSGSYVGGVVGENSGSVKNCYFLKTADVNKNLSGIGFGGEGQEAIQKTADAFHSGEVAWLLQKGQKAGEGGVVPLVWGQSNLTATTSLPTLVALDKANAQKESLPSHL